MPTYEVAAAPFPYVERPVRQRRPCLIVGRPEGGHELVWVLMITSAGNARLAGDVDIPDLDSAGLRAASVVRTAKIATVGLHDLRVIGRLSGPVAAAVRDHMDRWHERADTGA